MDYITRRDSGLAIKNYKKDVSKILIQKLNHLHFKK